MSCAGPPIVDLANFEERKEEIKNELMKAATTVGKQQVHQRKASGYMPGFRQTWALLVFCS